MAHVSEILSIAIILFVGYVLNILLSKIHVPGLVGMMILGIFIGPEFLNLISDGILNISSQLRSMALTIVLAQSGLHLDLDSLKKVGRPAILLSILPASFEIVGAMVGSHLLLDFTYPEGLTLGAVLGSVSPAIIAARMIGLINKRLGEKHAIPQLILAGAGCDDIFTIILFYAFLNIVGSSKFDWKTILGIPISIVSGVLLGLMTGFLTVLFFKKTNFELAANTLIVLSVSLLLNGFEELIDDLKKGTSWEFVAVSGLLGVIVNGIIILYKLPEKAHELSGAFSAVWRFFEIILFVLVGATLKFDNDLKNNIGKAILVLLFGLVFRSVGTYVSMIKTVLNLKEKIYIIVTFISKATVQASIGGIALARGYDCGKTILTVSVISIILTAPFGSAWMECMAPVLLDKPEDPKDVPAKEEDENKENKEEEPNKIELSPYVPQDENKNPNDIDNLELPPAEDEIKTGKTSNISNIKRIKFSTGKDNEKEVDIESNDKIGV